MDLHVLKIQGFRKHRNTTINFSDSTFLIGENNVGKSSVLAALEYLLNPKSKIPDEEFYSISDENNNITRKTDEVILTAEFRNLPEAAKQWHGFRGRVLNYSPEFEGDSGLGFVYRKTYKIGESSPKIEVKQYKKLLKDEFKDCKTINDYIENGLNIEDIPEKLKDFDYDQTLKTRDQNIIKDSDCLYDYDEECIEWIDNPGGFPQNVISKLPHFLLIPAQDRQEEITSNNGALQKTLEELFKEIRDSSDNYREAQKYLNRLQEELDPTKPGTEVSKMMAELNDVVADVFPSASILTMPNLSDPNTTIKPTFIVKMSSNISTNTSLQGTGMVRAAVFALLRYKCNRDSLKREEDARSLIIGFEEPELYLHPNAINKIRDTIYRLAESSNNQIVCTTHSPYMIDISRKPRQVLNSLSLLSEEIDGSTAESISVKPFNVTEEFINLQNDDQDYVKMLLKVDDSIAKCFFAKKVLIVEGDTEQIVLNETLTYLPRELESSIKSDWHIIRARGKAAIIPLIKYLKAMGIDVYVIHDGDYGVEGAEVFNGPIKQALDNDTHLVVLSNCIENAIGSPMVNKNKPFSSYKFIKDNWEKWADINSVWRDTIEKIFLNGEKVVIVERTTPEEN